MGRGRNRRKRRREANVYALPTRLTRPFLEDYYGLTPSQKYKKLTAAKAEADEWMAISGARHTERMGFKRPPTFGDWTETLKQRYARSVKGMIPTFTTPLKQLPRLSRVKKVVKKLKSPKILSKKLKVATAVAALNALSPQSAVCVERSQREEIMHALKKAGRFGQKKPRFTWKSKVRCK